MASGQFVCLMSNDKKQNVIFIQWRSVLKLNKLGYEPEEASCSTCLLSRKLYQTTVQTMMTPPISANVPGISVSGSSEKTPARNTHIGLSIGSIVEIRHASKAGVFLMPIAKKTYASPTCTSPRKTAELQATVLAVKTCGASKKIA